MMIKNFSLYNYLQITALSNSHLIPLSLNDKEYLTEYFTHESEYIGKGVSGTFTGGLLGYRYGDLLLDRRLYTVNGGQYSINRDLIENIIKGYINANDYRYKTLYNTMLFEYNPISNYDRQEDSTTTNNYGNRKETREIIDTMGEKVGSNTTTTNPTSSTITDTSTDYATTYENPSEQREKSKNVGENRVENGEIKNEFSYRDESISNDRNDTFEVDSHEDTSTVSSKISGNIGVTTTQEMIESERKVALFSFYDILLHDIIMLITEGVW